MDDHLDLHAVPHPDARVRRLGFDLTHPYVEQCWGAMIGPSGVAILRRAPVLWTAAEPARVPAGELARSLGLGSGTGVHGRFPRALGRLVAFRFAEWVDDGRGLGIYTEVPPLGPKQVARLPEWCQAAHDRLLGAHLDAIAAGSTTPMTSPPAAVSITARLDRLQHSTPSPATALDGLGR